MKKRLKICTFIICLFLLTGCMTQPSQNNEAGEEQEHLEAYEGKIKEFEQRIDELKEKHESKRKLLEDDLDAHKMFVDKAIKHLDEDTLLELAKNEWTYEIVVNGRPLPSDGRLEVEHGDVEITLSESTPTFSALPNDILLAGAISGEYGEHLLVKGIEPNEIVRTDGTIVTAFIYKFENMSQNKTIELEVSDELKERLNLEKNEIYIRVK